MGTVCLHMRMKCVSKWLCLCVQEFIHALKCVQAVCVGIATLVYSCVMGHYASCIVYEVVPEFQTDP